MGRNTNDNDNDNDNDNGESVDAGEITDDIAHMSKVEMIAEIRRMRWATAAARENLVRYEDVELDNARLRDGQMELADLGSRYMDLYEGAPVPYAVVSDGGVIDDLNREAAQWFGAEMYELRGKPLSRFIVAKERRAVTEHFKTCVARERVMSLTTSFQLPGHAKPSTVKMLSRPLGKHSATSGCRTVFFDLTQEQRNEDELRIAVRMREDFLAVVAHDLRSPLAAVVMSAELLERHAPNSQEIERIRRAATRMNRLVADLLDVSSMEAGHLAMEPALENVEAIIVAALEISSPLAARKNISLSARVDDSALTAWCDRERVIQALLNLITNAVKFTTTGSISVRAKRCADEVHIVVHDTGRGLSRSQIDHIFDPYWQASPQAREGTGLGLSIVKGIVQLHGGRIWAESIAGRGSSFSFTFE